MKTVFLFQGQGGFHQETCRALFFQETFSEYQRITDGLLLDKHEQSFSDWLSQEDESGDPVYGQVGIFVEGYLSALQKTQKDGYSPDLLMGHSFGEFAALAFSGAISFKDGLQLILARQLSLRGMGKRGKMAAVSANEKKVSDLLKELPSHQLEISVLNHPKQTIVSGPETDISRLNEHARQHGVSVTQIASKYPFHSSLLSKSKERFVRYTNTVDYKQAEMDVYFPVEHILYASEKNVGQLLANHLVEKFSFIDAIDTLIAQDVTHFVECGGGSMLQKIIHKSLSQNGRNDPIQLSGYDGSVIFPHIHLHTPTQHHYHSEALSMEPLAIIGYGAVLPSATDSEQYWFNMERGINGVYNYSDIDPHFIEDCYSEGEVKVGKTYSELCGYITPESLEQAAKTRSVHFKEHYAKVQKMIALSLNEALDKAKLQPNASIFKNSVSFLGATPDGIQEYDDALVFDQIKKELQFSPEMHEQFEKIFTNASPQTYAPDLIYDKVLSDVLGVDIPTTQIDAACSSSLYALDLASKSLLAGESDIAICGGAFAPSIGSNCMFAQFNGLARDVISPLGDDAEGTVFGDGSVIFLLRKLSDAVKDSNPIHGVIRGSGLSSDGNSPAVNVPSTAGQSLAMERAYKSASIDKHTIQYVEAHATGTSGDLVEFKSLKQVFCDPRPDGTKVFLGSNKALIGHTGWASGASAVLKLIQAMEQKVIPAHYIKGELNQQLELESSNFDIPRTNSVWQPNVDGLPRRAAINSFGFGGTNAHFIIEEYLPAYHAQIINQLTDIPRSGVKKQKLVVVGKNTVFPPTADEASLFAGHRFNNERIALPKGKLILPDVSEQMAKAQLLAVNAADPLITMLVDHGIDKEEVGVVISFNDKCERACAANIHIYKDHILRIASKQSDEGLVKRLTEWFEQYESEHLLINPYTLAGVMPNVITGRVTNFYDLKGPNFIVGNTQAGLLPSIKAAQDLILNNDAEIVLCGGIQLSNSPFLQHKTEASEGGIMFAVTSEEIARKYNLDIMAELSLCEMESTMEVLKEAV